uniref:Pectinesterase n=1 Tax=Kalanchoe fedtschenkoi TaxID=63787 RepID=A0A7N0T2K6_KALFE
MGGDDEKKRKAGINAVTSMMMMLAMAHCASTSHVSMTQKAVQAICEPVKYKETCKESLSLANTTNPRDLIRIGFDAAKRHLAAALHTSTSLTKTETDPQTEKALKVCNQMLDMAIYDLQKSFDKMGQFELFRVDEYLDDIQTWLSGAVTYRVTCLDAFENNTSSARRKMEKTLKAAAEINTNALSMVNKIKNLVKSFDGLGKSRPRPLFARNHGYPVWVDHGRRKLLATNSTEGPVVADAVVDKDQSGNFTTLTAALAAVPVRPDNKTYVIHVKEGVYEEKVTIPYNLTHLTVIGDGPDKTIFTGRLNFVDGTLTVDTATFSALGSNFMAMNMGFKNTAGAVKEQAVALHVGGDMSIIYNCSIQAYQDTLYAHAHRQFYRDCNISGTIDFIFGNAAAVFQNCLLLIRKPLHGQDNMITAHGRTEPGANTGLVIQNCTISGEPEYLGVKDVSRTYLGRPWKPYARTLIVDSQIDDVIDRSGWATWPGADYDKTCWFAEFRNRGPGKAGRLRANWPGIRKVDAVQVADFLPENFIYADHWIEQSGVPFSPGNKTT